MDNILSLIMLLGAIQGGILSVVLFWSRFNHTANKVLSLSILVISIALLLAYFQLVLDYKDYPFHIKSILPLSLIFVPLIYLYTKLNTKENKRIIILDLKYFLPFFVVFICNIPFYFGDTAKKIEYFERENISHSALFIDQLEIVFVNLVVFIFSILIISLVLKMRKNFENEVSNYREEIIKMMFFMAWAILVFTFTGFLLSVFQILEVNYPVILDFLTAIGSTFLIYFIGYYSLLHPQIFRPLNEKTEIESTKTVRESKDNIEDMSDVYLSKIINRMEKEKDYRDQELTLQSFSGNINIPSYLTSKIINTKTGLNFYNFVNKYRIEEVKQELIKSNSPQIMQIAFDSGFNTKSSFYNYFKKHVGISPKEFIKQTPV